MTTRRATLHCSHPDHNPHYLPLSDECPGFDFNSLVGHEGAKVIELPSGDYCPHHPYGCDEPDKDRDV